MVYHNLKLAWRNISRNKVFSSINVAGMTLGLSCCIIIGLYVYTENSFDKFHPNHARIFRVNKILNEKGKGAQSDGISPGPLAPALAQEAPGIALAARFRPWFNDMLVSYDTVRLKLNDVCYADASFLQIFEFPLLSGNKGTALSEPFTAVITESTAKKFFANGNPIGKKMKTLNDIPVTITGVAKDPPANSSIQFTMLISWPTVTAASTANYFFWMNSWTTNVVYSFVLLKENVSSSTLDPVVSKILHAHLPENEFTYTTYLQALDDIHLHSANIVFADSFRTNNGKIVFTLLIIAVFILLIGCFNFINLTTAGALARAKATGVQKVLGAGKGQLIMKFFTETVLLLAISLLCAILLASYLLPYFNELTGSRISVLDLVKPRIIAAFAGLFFLLSLIAGLYPAFFLSRFKSTDVFRNILRAGKDVWLRKTLVTVQFSLSILLIISTIVVNKQIQFLTTKDLGFNKDQVVVIQLANTHLESRTREFMNALKQDPAIQSLTVTNRVPGQTFNGYGVVPEGYRLEDHIMANVLETDAQFPATYNIQVVQGRYFSPEMSTDTSKAVVINESMAKQLHWTHPVGKEFEVYQETKGRVVGVVKDFNFASLRESIKPLVLMLRNNPLYLSVKLGPQGTKASLDHMKALWKEFDQENPIEYFFIDEQLNHFYESDIRLLRVLSIFAGLAIGIACVGLFGLSIFATRQRTKEIGIRKVLGAPVAAIVGLLSRDFLSLVIIASLVAFPLGWWAMNSWMQDFAFRTPLSWWIFVLSGFIVVVIAMVTVSFHSIRAALANPAESLRTE